MLRENFDARCEAYINAMKVMFRQIPQTIKIALAPKQKVQKLMTDIGGGWYMVKIARGIPPLRITKLSKKHKKVRMKFKKNYMKLISGGMIGNSNCIGTNFTSNPRSDYL